jgi:hypothetical protein
MRVLVEEDLPQTPGPVFSLASNRMTVDVIRLAALRLRQSGGTSKNAAMRSPAHLVRCEKPCGQLSADAGRVAHGERDERLATSLSAHVMGISPEPG